MRREKSVKRRQGNRREAVLAAAARRFFRDGYAAASMRDIAADAAMQASSIYYHFPSKADLLAAVHEEGMHQITDASCKGLGEFTAGGAKDFQVHAERRAAFFALINDRQRAERFLQDYAPVPEQ